LLGQSARRKHRPLPGIEIDDAIEIAEKIEI